jgi:hypothetical protein
LEPNIDIPYKDSHQMTKFGMNLSGHAFGTVYLTEKPKDIINPIKEKINNLKTSSTTTTTPSGCFDKPRLEHLNKSVGETLGASKTTFSSLFVAGTLAVKGTLATGDTLLKVGEVGNQLAKQAGDKLAEGITWTTEKTITTTTSLVKQTSKGITKLLTSTTTLPKQANKPLTNKLITRPKEKNYCPIARNTTVQAPTPRDVYLKTEIKKLKVLTTFQQAKDSLTPIKSKVSSPKEKLLRKGK